MASIRTFIPNFLAGHSVLNISSRFGKRNLFGKVQSHNGVDIAVPVGTPLSSPVDGRIIDIKTQRNGAGLYVRIRHTINSSLFFDIYFMHLSVVDSSLRVGQTISQGSSIGRTGGNPSDQPNAGTSTGPHLHIEIRKNGTQPVDPLYSWMIRSRCIDKKTSAILTKGTGGESFDSDNLRTQSAYSYSSKEDTTLQGETEYVKPKKQPVPTDVKERLAPGIWQITKLLIDESVADKQVHDSGISVMTGSLINWFNKVCQPPLVEFFGDTFGDQYYWIVRRPPFDSEGINGMYNTTKLDIPEDIIMSTSLGWNNQDVYSWYRYTPYGDLLGIQQAQLFCPAVFFPEYASIWGSRPLDVSSNYFHYLFSGRYNSDKPNNGVNGDIIIRNALKDFRYLVESNAYRPFTRRGTIVLQGDRRFKRGTLVMTPWEEIFYVDSVSQDYSISTNGVERTTVLNVSRGMQLQYINPDNVDPQSGLNISYFNIIDFGDYDVEEATSENWRKIIGEWKVNYDVFGYFMRREQIIQSTIMNERS